MLLALLERPDRVGGRVGERLRALSRPCLADYDQAAARWPAPKDALRAELSGHN